MVQPRGIEANLGQVRLGKANLDQAFVDGGPGARGTLVIHRGDNAAFAAGLVLLENNDLGILAAEFYHRTGVRIVFFNRDRYRVDLLYETGTDEVAQHGRSGAGDENLPVAVADIGKLCANLAEEGKGEFRLPRLMALV